MTETIVTDVRDLFHFVGVEESNLATSIHKFRDELQLFTEVDGHIRAAIIRRSPFPRSHKVIAQLFLFVHYHLYFSVTTLMRCHWSDAFHSLRTAIDATLIAYWIIEGAGTPEGYLARERAFRNIPAEIRRRRNQGPLNFEKADQLLQLHEVCSEVASHADHSVFSYRLEEDANTMRLHYFQYPRSQNEFRFYYLLILQAFVRMSLIFAKAVVTDLKLLPPKWQQSLEEIQVRIQKSIDGTGVAKEFAKDYAEFEKRNSKRSDDG